MSTQSIGPTRKAQLLDAAQTARRRFVSATKDLHKAGISFIDRAPPLEQSLLEGCKVFADRKLLMNSLPRGGVMAEIGVDRGEFSRFLLDTMQPQVLHLFDIAPERIDPNNLENAFRENRAVLHAGNSSENMARLEKNSFDIIYVDGDHFYEGVLADLIASEMKLKPGGYIVLNDYTSWSPASMSKCGVAKAANEFILSRRWQVKALALQSAGYYDLCIQKPSDAA